MKCIHFLLGVPFSIRQWRLARQGDNRSLEDGFSSPAILEAVKEELREETYPSGFHVDRNDDLLKVYGLYGSDLDELILRIFAKLEISPPDTTILEGYPKVRTAGDLVKFIAFARENEEE